MTDLQTTAAVMHGEVTQLGVGDDGTKSSGGDERHWPGCQRAGLTLDEQRARSRLDYQHDVELIVHVRFNRRAGLEHNEIGVELSAVETPNRPAARHDQPKSGLGDQRLPRYNTHPISA